MNVGFFSRRLGLAGLRDVVVVIANVVTCSVAKEVLCSRLFGVLISMSQ